MQIFDDDDCFKIWPETQFEECMLLGYHDGKGYCEVELRKGFGDGQLEGWYIKIKKEGIHASNVKIKKKKKK